jgi:hypothetical protein
MSQEADSIFTLSEREMRLFAMGAFGFIAIDEGNVNLDDLLNAHKHPMAIVRCYGNPNECIKFVPSLNTEALGCVAGWLNDDEP